MKPGQIVTQEGKTYRLKSRETILWSHRTDKDPEVITVELWLARHLATGELIEIEIVKENK